MSGNLEGDYTPTKLVTYLHARDHPGYTGSKFDSSYLKATGGDDSYVKSLAALSAVAISIGFIFIGAYCGILWARRGCWKDKEFSRFSIGFTLDTDTYRLRSKGSRPVRFVLIVGFVSCIIVMFHTISGSAPLSSAVVTMTDVSAKLAKIFVDLETNSKTMTADATTIKNTAAACGASAAQYTAAVTTFQNSVNAMQNEWVGSGVNMKQLAARISSDGSHYVNLYVRLLVGLMLIPTGLGIAAAILSKSDIMAGASCSGICVLAFLSISMGTMISLSVGVADYCMTPTANALDAVKNMAEPQKLQNLASYFTSCSGQNPLLGVLATTGNAITAISGLQCGAAAAKTQIDNICTKNSQAVDTMKQNLDCKTIQHLYQSATYDALCKDGIRGVYQLWVIQASTGMVFLVTLVFAAFVNLDKNPDDLDDDDNTPTARAKRRRRLKEKRRKSRQRKRSQGTLDGVPRSYSSSISREGDEVAPLRKGDILGATKGGSEEIVV